MSRVRAYALAVAAAATLATVRPAAATGGIQIDEQSAAAVGMASAHTAVANDPGALFYNPAGLAFQPGFGALVGGDVIIARTQVSPDRLTLWYAVPIPTLYVAQRFGRYVSLGVGTFANFGEHFSYPPDWRGRYQGFFIDVTTFTVQPTIAIRLFSWLSIGVGLDLLRGRFDLYQALNFGGADGNAHAGGDGTGIGGNVGLLLRLVPRYLNIGFSYRSRMDIDMDGPGAVKLPPELAAMQPGLQRAQLTLPLPHNFAVGVAGFLGQLIVSFEVKVSLWRDLQQLTLVLNDPATTTAATSAGAPSPTTTTVLPLDLHNTWAVRGGAQYGFLADRLRVRVGAGYDTTPLPTSRLGPLLPDTNRVIVSAGLGLHWSRVSLDVAYMAVFLLKTTSTDPNLIATYQTFGQVVSASFTFVLEHMLQRREHRAYMPEEE